MENYKSYNYPLMESEEDKEERKRYANSVIMKYILVENENGCMYEFEIIPNTPDGNCMFRAIAQAIYNSEIKHTDVRKEIIDFIIHERNWKKYLPYIQAQHDHLIKSKQIGIKMSTPLDDNNNDNEIKQEMKAKEQSMIWKREYLNYMRNGCIFGTMQEMQAASEYFQFNLIIIREIEKELYNVQNFTEQNWLNTQFFYFTGDAENGHFELLFPLQRDIIYYNIPNGNYKQIERNPCTRQVIIQEILRQPLDRKKIKAKRKNNKNKGVISKNGMEDTIESDNVSLSSSEKSQKSTSSSKSKQLNSQHKNSKIHASRVAIRNHMEDSIKQYKYKDSLENNNNNKNKNPYNLNNSIEYIKSQNPLYKNINYTNKYMNPDHNKLINNLKNRPKLKLCTDERNNNNNNDTTTMMKPLEISTKSKMTHDNFKNNFEKFHNFTAPNKNNVQHTSSLILPNQIKSENDDDDENQFGLKYKHHSDDDTKKGSYVSYNSSIDVDVPPCNSSRSLIARHQSQQLENNEDDLSIAKPLEFYADLKIESEIVPKEDSCSSDNSIPLKTKNFIEKRVPILQIGNFEQSKLPKITIKTIMTKLRKGGVLALNILCCLLCPCIFLLVHKR